MGDEPNISYGFIDAVTGEPVRLSHEIHSSDEYGDLDVPGFSADPIQPIYRVVSPEILGLAVEENPMNLNASDRLPMFRDYAYRMGDLVPVRYEEKRNILRDEKGRAVAFETELKATRVPVNLPVLVKCRAWLADRNASLLRKFKSDIASCGYLLVGDPTEIALFTPHIGDRIRLNGRRMETFPVIAAEVIEAKLVVALGKPRYVTEPEEPAATSSFSPRR